MALSWHRSGASPAASGPVRSPRASAKTEPRLATAEPHLALVELAERWAGLVVFTAALGTAWFWAAILCAWGLGLGPAWSSPRLEVDLAVATGVLASVVPLAAAAVIAVTASRLGPARVVLAARWLTVMNTTMAMAVVALAWAVGVFGPLSLTKVVVVGGCGVAAAVLVMLGLLVDEAVWTTTDEAEVLALGREADRLAQVAVIWAKPGAPGASRPGSIRRTVGVEAAAVLASVGLTGVLGLRAGGSARDLVAMIWVPVVWLAGLRVAWCLTAIGGHRWRLRAVEASASALVQVLALLVGGLGLVRLGPWAWPVVAASVVLVGASAGGRWGLGALRVSVAVLARRSRDAVLRRRELLVARGTGRLPPGRAPIGGGPLVRWHRRMSGRAGAVQAPTVEPSSPR